MLNDRRTPLGHACTDMRSASGMLLENAKQAGAARADLDPGSMLLLVNGIAMATEHAPEGAASLLPWLLEGILEQPVRPASQNRPLG